MPFIRHRIGLFCIALLVVGSISCELHGNTNCWTGAFIADSPRRQDIEKFKTEYGKKPHLIMLFLAWNNFPDQQVINDIYEQNSTAFITLEPWEPKSKTGIRFDGIIEGQEDGYLRQLAQQIQKIGKPVLIRFAHELNGNWYPWAGTKIGAEKWIAAYRHVKDVFDRQGVENVSWIFSINWQNVPAENNDWKTYYPGDQYVDYIGVDGYNWGNTQSWSRWMSFGEIFDSVLIDIKRSYEKPVLISEFGSTDSGGDKAAWIKEALTTISQKPEIRGFVLFNIDKEARWHISTDKPEGLELKKQLNKECFKE